jgi:peptidoglycan/xylan/chitin deacetylase (PgdA/CDA1 family)
MKKRAGYFVVSLDLELFWGMVDKATLESYGPAVKGERTAIPRLLSLFSEYGIHATWATVGMIMAKNRTELLHYAPPPKLRPRYRHEASSTYHHLNLGHVGKDEASDPYHFGPTLVSLIHGTPHQEIGNHTFSHYYCVDEATPQPDCFAADLTAFTAIAAERGITAESFVFPRNQWTETARAALPRAGITTYRGTEQHFLYRARPDSEQTRPLRALRLLDHYLNLSGHHTYPLPAPDAAGLVNLPASRFLRPYHPLLRPFERLRLSRITRAMTHAATRGEVFHLWWHPHNFGLHQEENFRNLRVILDQYQRLSKQYGFTSMTMGELAKCARANTKSARSQ